MMKIAGMFSVPLGLLIYFVAFPDWDDEKHALLIFAGNALSMIIGFLTILGGLQLIATLPKDDSVRELVRTKKAPPKNLPKLQAQTASGQAWTRWWLHLLKTVAVFTLPTLTGYQLIILSDENPDFHPNLVGAGILLSLIAFFVGGIYGLFLLDDFPRDASTDASEEDDDDDD